MTTIATDGITIAADTQMSDNGYIIQRPVTKIVCEQGMVFGFSGTYPLFRPMLDWFLESCDAKDFPSFDSDAGWGRLWVFDPRGMIFEYYSKAPYPVQLPLPAAMGSGADFAIGAMAHGATPLEAVQTAIANDTYTGGQAVSYLYPTIAQEQGLVYHGESGTQAQDPCYTGTDSQPGQQEPFNPDELARIEGRRRA